MKKLLLITISLFALSCSNDDSSTQQTDDEGLILDESGTYRSILLYKNCSNNGATKSGGKKYCVTDDVYFNTSVPSEPCTIVTITDVDGNQRTGYWGEKLNSGDCHREP